MGTKRLEKVCVGRYCTAAAWLLCASTPAALAEPPFSEWSAPGPVPGQQVPDGCPIESRDGNSLFTASGRPPGSLNIWVYTRDGRAGSFSGPTLVPAPVSHETANDFCPTPLEGNWLMFVSDRAGGCGSADIYISRRNPSGGWTEPRNLGCAPDGPNTAGQELGPAMVTTSRGMYLYYSTSVDGDQNIYESLMMPSGVFGPGAAVEELNTAYADQQPNVRRDGLEIVFASNRDGTQDIWSASRDSVDAPWSGLRNLSTELAFPTAADEETRPSLSWDRLRLYYGASGVVYLSERAAADEAAVHGPAE